MKKTVCVLLAAAAALAGAVAHAEEKFPIRPIRIIVPFAAGGVGDIVARTLSVPLADTLGQPVIVDNRAGADGVAGTEYAAKSAPDGYTILQVSTPQSINQVLREKPRYDLLRDFTPIARAASGNLVLVTAASSPVKTVADLVALAKTKPNGLSFGSGGVGSVGHLSGELLKRAAGIQAVHVAYKGNSAVLPDLIGGRLDYFFASQPEAVTGVAGGHLRALAVTSTQRVPNFPDVPTMAEAGFPNFEASSSYGYLLPANTPPAIARQLQAAFAKAVADAKVQERLNALGLTTSYGGPDELTAVLRSEMTHWGQVIKAANIRAD